MANTNEVKQLKFPENVRTRFGMYIGDANTCDVVLRECSDNNIDEMLSGHANKTWIFMLNEGKVPKGEIRSKYYVTADNGRGIPISEAYDEDKDVNGNVIKRTPMGITQCQLAVGTLHAGSKFNKDFISCGLNGVGVSCTNSLASEFYEFSNLACATVSKAPEYLQKFINTWNKEHPDGKGFYYIKYNKGYKSDEGVMDFSDILKLLELPDNAFGEDIPSTITAFYPDMSIFKSNSAKIPVACKFVKKMNLNKELHFYINGIENLDEVPDYGYNLNVRCNNPATGIEASKNPWIDFVVSFGIAEKLTETEYVASVNGLDTQSGKHLRMVRNAYCNAFKSLFGSCMGKEDLGINFTVIMSCYEPVFSSQTKETLYDVPGFNYNSLPSLEKAFKKIINDNKEVFEQNYLRILQYLDSMNALGKLGKIKAKVAIASEAGARSAIYTPIKLKDCSSRDRRKCELYLTEGDSAGSTLLMGRDPSIHAVLPLRGKCKNTVNMDIVDVLDNNEMYDIINSIGTGVDDHHDLSEVRYGKIILAADAD